MTALLTGNLPLIAEAPEGIRKLRGLILELAVRGRLVPQDPSDEPAGELLKRITREASANNLKSQTSQSDDSGPYRLPNGWSWTQFGRVAQHNSGKTLDKGRNSGIPRRYITTSNLYWGKFQLDDLREMLIRDGELERCTARKNDLLICEGGEAGRAAVWESDEEVCFQNHVHRARMLGNVSSYYAYRIFQKLDLTGEINLYRKGVGISNLSGKALSSIPFPLPPLAEQHRIVAKVDELMALCDRLEAEQADTEVAHARLVDALLAALTRSTDAADFAANWQRLAAHFDTLFTTEAAIDALKQTVLQLATIGKLTANSHEGWETLPLDKICQAIVDCPHSTPKWTTSGKICVRTSQFSPGKLDLSTSRFVSESTFKERTARLKPVANDILYSREGGILGIACRIPEGAEICLGQRMMLIRSGDRIIPAFLEIVLNAPLITGLARRCTTGGAAPRVNVSTIKSYPIPLPPLAEQHRIVAKVNELTTLCDRLKADLASARQRQATLADTLIAATLEAA